MTKTDDTYYGENLADALAFEADWVDSQRDFFGSQTRTVTIMRKAAALLKKYQDGEKMQKLKKSNADVTGTSLQGYIETTYARLVVAFGEPSHDGDGYKTDAEWVLESDDGYVVTIYNYKDGKNYNGDSGLDVEDITEWHIGGRNERAVALVQEALPDTHTRKGWL